MWRKSSYSDYNGNCVEASGPWVKSSYSAHNGSCVEWVTSSRCAAGECVEVHPGNLVGVRDSKLAASPVLWFEPGAWKAFIDTLRTG